MTGLILAGCAPRGPQRAAEHSTPPSYLRSRGAGVAPSLRPTSADLSVPAAFSYTDSEGETSDCIFYAATDVPVGLVVYLDGDGQSFHSQGNQSRDERSRGGLAGVGGVVEAASARGYDEEQAMFSDGAKERLSLNWVTGTRDVPANSLDGFDGIGHARNSLAYYRAAGFRHTWNEWPDDDHGSITEKFGSYVGRVLDAASSGK